MLEAQVPAAARSSRRAARAATASRSGRGRSAPGCRRRAASRGADRGCLKLSPRIRRVPAPPSAILASSSVISVQPSRSSLCLRRTSATKIFVIEAIARGSSACLPSSSWWVRASRMATLGEAKRGTSAWAIPAKTATMASARARSHYRMPSPCDRCRSLPSICSSSHARSTSSPSRSRNQPKGARRPLDHEGRRRGAWPEGEAPSRSSGAATKASAEGTATAEIDAGTGDKQGRVSRRRWPRSRARRSGLRRAGATARPTRIIACATASGSRPAPIARARCSGRRRCSSFEGKWWNMARRRIPAK